MLLLVTLLFAAAANGGVAPVVGPEIASTPIRTFAGFPNAALSPHLVQPAAPLATDGDGFVIAFTALSDDGKARTTVMRLDSQAYAVAGTARELPATQPYYDAVDPDVVAAPNGFYVAQTELSPLSSRVVVWHLDRALRPDALPVSIVPTEKGIGSAIVPPGLVRVAGNRVAVVTDHAVVDYDLAGAPLRTTPLPFAPDDAVFASGALVAGGVDSAPDVQLCGFRFPCATVPQHFNVFLSFDGTFPPQARYSSFYTNDRIALATDGSTLFYFFDKYFKQPGLGGGYMSFLRFEAVHGGAIDVEPRTVATFNAIDGDIAARPSAAFDGTRFLIVWRTAANERHAVGAAAIERDGTVTLIDIPNLADETLPFVVAAGPNRFLVSYLTRSGDVHRIAGRFITFGGRRPVVKR